MSTFAYLKPLAEAAFRVAEAFDETTPTPPAEAVIDLTDVGELLGDIVADLDDAHNRTHGAALLEDLRLKWLGVIAMRTTSGDDIDALQYTFTNVADDVLGMILEDVEASEHDAELRTYGERPVTLAHVWCHPRTMFTANAALGLWLRLASWDADHDGTGRIADETLRHITPELWHHTIAHLEDLTLAGLVEHVDGGWRLLERLDDGGQR